ncbi:MAG: class F sortase [Candidatus Nomurabacteria bacterium]|jgi:LPXTG-site transpeptidase (sortase) family protein|nr:class F sortase [Candidatus Nomurabacteria bacterium]
MEVFSRLRHRRFLAILPLLVGVFALFAATSYLIIRDFRATSAIAIYREPNEPARLSIPSIGLDAPVVASGFEPDSRKPAVPDTEVGWFTESSALGQAGVVFLVGHNNTIFGSLPQVKIGDHLTITPFSDIMREETFEVYSITTEPRTTLNMNQVLSAQNYDFELVLMTCAGEPDPNLSTYTHRLIIRARRI